MEKDDINGIIYRWYEEGSRFSFFFGVLLVGVENIAAILQITSVHCYFLCFLYLFFEKLLIHGNVMF